MGVSALDRAGVEVYYTIFWGDTELCRLCEERMEESVVREREESRERELQRISLSP